MVLILTLQLLMLLLATTGFAGAPPGCPSPSLQNGSPVIGRFQLTNILMGFAHLSYNCTNSGSYEIVEVDTELFDATCVNGTEYLEEVVDATVVYVQDNPGTSFPELGVFIEEKFNFNAAGQLKSINTTSLEIDFGVSVNGQNGDTTVVVTVSEDYEGDQGTQMTNEDETLLILVEFIVIESDAPSPSTCAVGYAGSVDVAVLMRVYESEPEEDY